MPKAERVKICEANFQVKRWHNASRERPSNEKGMTAAEPLLSSLACYLSFLQLHIVLDELYHIGSVGARGEDLCYASFLESGNVALRDNAAADD